MDTKQLIYELRNTENPVNIEAAERLERFQELVEWFYGWMPKYADFKYERTKIEKVLRAS